MNTQTPENKNEEPVVLLIDDSIDVHRLLAARLRSEPIQLICASTGADGLEIANQITPAVILLDLDMPNFIVTPHVAWASREAMQILADQLIDNIEAFVADKPQNVVV